MNKPENIAKITSNNGYVRVSTSDLQVETNFDNNFTSIINNYDDDDDEEDEFSANSDLVV
jgi:hypothetical protein